MAESLGLSQKQYSRVEASESGLTLKRLEEIAGLLGMSTIDLMSFDERAFFNQCTQRHVLGSHNTYNESNEKEVEVLRDRIDHLEEEVRFLREQLVKASDKSS